MREAAVSDRASRDGCCRYESASECAAASDCPAVSVSDLTIAASFMEVMKQMLLYTGVIILQPLEE